MLAGIDEGTWQIAVAGIGQTSTSILRPAGKCQTLPRKPDREGAKGGIEETSYVKTGDLSCRLEAVRLAHKAAFSSR